MRVVDTSAWIEWLVGSPSGRTVGGELPPRERWIVPSIVQLELAKWLTREVGEDEADRVTAFSQRCVVVPLDTPLAAAEAALRHKLALADAVVLATARAQGADLLTCDAHFEGLPGVALIRKVPP